MAYDVTMVEFMTAGVGGIGTAGFPSYSGFPTVPFNYAVASMWVCLPFSAPSGVAFSAAWPFIKINPESPDDQLNLQLVNNLLTVFYNATYSVPLRNLRSHILISVNCVTQTVQLYINDAPVVPATGGWLSASQMGIGASRAIDIEASGNAAGHGPALADVWVAATPGFIDLSVTANRRKFIHDDLSPVYLLADGSGPVGASPPIFLTVPASGVPSDIQANYGTGDDYSILASGVTLQFQTAGVCTLPPPPPPPPTTLALDNVTAFTEAGADSQLVFLSWSDDRAHTWGNPVGQPIGDRGEYSTNCQWQRLGYARDRVFKLEWSVPVATALLGAYIEIDSSAKS